MNQSADDLAISNVSYLMEVRGWSPYEMEMQTGIARSTVTRFLKGEVKSQPKTLSALGKPFQVSAHDLKNVDLRQRDKERGVALDASLVVIRPLDKFGNVRRSLPFPVIEMSREYFDTKLGYDPFHCRFVAMHDTTMRPALDLGEVGLVDTLDTEVKKGVSGIYAFTFWGEPHIKYLRLEADNNIRYYGSNAAVDNYLIVGDELDGLRILGRVKDKISLQKL